MLIQYSISIHSSLPTPAGAANLEKELAYWGKADSSLPI